MLNKYWIKCTTEEPDEVILTVKAANEHEAKERIKTNYNVIHIIEIKNEPYISKKDFLIDGLTKICKNHLDAYKYRSRKVFDESLYLMGG
jgi:hypothetical protein